MKRQQWLFFKVFSKTLTPQLNSYNNVCRPFCSAATTNMSFATLRLRWACKYLSDLITRDPAFIMKNYLHHYSTTATTNTYDDDDDDGNRILNNASFWVSDSKTVVYTMKFGDVVNNDHESGQLVPMDCYNLPFSDLDDDDYFQFSNSGNGLILIYLDRSEKLDMCWLWNPCTREVREIPNIFPVNDSSQWRIYGLGYDHTIDDYKVIRLTGYDSQPLNGNLHHNHLKMIDIGVYTLGSNSWSSKIVTDPILTAEKIISPGLLVNGALHWIDYRGIGTITSFDIIKEEFREIEGPNTELFFPVELSVLNGCLCICQLHGLNDYVIWMMKEYGVKDSWTKLFTINMRKTHAAPSYNCMLTRWNKEPFEQYYKDGGILMVFNFNARGMIIVACDSKNDKARFIYSITTQKKGFGFGSRFRNGTYTESSVSLNSGIYLTLAAGSRTLSRPFRIQGKNQNPQQIYIFGEERHLKNGTERRRRRRRRKRRRLFM